MILKIQQRLQRLIATTCNLEALILAYYGMTKLHKLVTTPYPSLPPILSAVNVPSYKTAEFYVPLLIPLTSDDFNITDSFSFAEEVSSFDCAH